MFKRLKTILFLLIIALKLFGQSNFIVEGKEYPIGLFTKTYKFCFRFNNDSLNTYLLDSTINYSNPQKTINKRVHYSCDNINKHEPTTSISYTGKNGKDWISRTYNGNILSYIYESKHDSLGRVIYYGRKDLKDSTNGFEWFYDYKDSLTSKGRRINIQTIYVDSKLGHGKEFHFMVLSEYDKKNRKIKETRQNKENDPMACITIYKYNKHDSLVSEKTWGREFISKKKRKNTKCNNVNQIDFAEKDFQSVKTKIFDLVLKNKNILTSNKCKYFYARYFSGNESEEIVIQKLRDSYHSPEVTYTITKKGSP